MARDRNQDKQEPQKRDKGAEEEAKRSQLSRFLEIVRGLGSRLRDIDLPQFPAGEEEAAIAGGGFQQEQLRQAQIAALMAELESQAPAAPPAGPQFVGDLPQLPPGARPIAPRR